MGAGGPERGCGLGPRGIRWPLLASHRLLREEAPGKRKRVPPPPLPAPSAWMQAPTFSKTGSGPKPELSSQHSQRTRSCTVSFPEDKSCSYHRFSLLPRPTEGWTVPAP